jgi:hypothetical protein
MFDLSVSLHVDRRSYDGAGSRNGGVIMEKCVGKVETPGTARNIYRNLLNDGRRRIVCGKVDEIFHIRCHCLNYEER